MSNTLVGIILGVIFNDLFGTWGALWLFGLPCLLLSTQKSLRPASRLLLWAIVTVALVPAPQGSQGEGQGSPLKVVTTSQGRFGGYSLVVRDREGLVRLRSTTLWQKGSWVKRSKTNEAFPVAARRAAPERSPDLMRAMTIGGRAPRPERELFTRLGIAHLLAISGLHMSVLLLLGLGALRLIYGRFAGVIPMERQHLEVVVAVPLVWWYWHFTGGAISTTRAALMVTLYFVLLRPLGVGTPLGALGVAFVLLAAATPDALGDPSLTLSFAAVLGILLMVRLGKGGISRYMLASFGATLFTSVVAWFHFGVVVPHGLVVNLLVVPLFSFFILPLGILGHLTGLFWHAGGGMLLRLPAWVLSTLLGLLTRVDPLLPTGSARVLVPVTLAHLLLAGLFFTKPTLRRVPLLLTALLVLAIPRLLAPATVCPELILFARGESDTAVLRLTGGRAVVIDAGWPGIGAWLRKNGVTKVEALYVSHNHSDHYAGVASITSRMEVKRCFHSGGRVPRVLAKALRGVPTVAPAPLHWETAGASITLLSQAHGGRATRATHLSENDNSLVLLVHVAGKRLLFPGDVERPGEARIHLKGESSRPVYFMKVPHHGHRNGTWDRLLKMRPRFVFVPGGSPAPEVVGRLRRVGATFLDGSGGVTRVSLCGPPHGRE